MGRKERKFRQKLQRLVNRYDGLAPPDRELALQEAAQKMREIRDEWEPSDG